MAASNVKGFWQPSLSGYRWVTPDIVSGPNVKKIMTPVGQVWGPYKKSYTKSMFGQDLFTHPGHVDGVPILCRCRDIKEFMRSSNGSLELGAAGTLLGGQLPACWEDSESIMNPSGGDTFNVTVGHPGFYSYAVNPGGTIGALTGFQGFRFGGNRSKKVSRKTNGKTKRQAKRR